MAPLLESVQGVWIEIYGREHLPVHIHAKYAEHEALVNIRTREIIQGSLPLKKLRIVKEWLLEDERYKLIEQNFYELNPRLTPPTEDI